MGRLGDPDRERVLAKEEGIVEKAVKEVTEFVVYCYVYEGAKGRSGYGKVSDSELLSRAVARMVVVSKEK